MSGAPLAVAVLISGRGSNLQAIIDDAATAGCPFRVAGVISNEPDAGGLDRARAAGIPTRVVHHRDYDSRESFDAALVEAVEHFRPELVVLAGFMRVLTGVFVDRFAGRLVNIHPSLLPAFPGLDTHARAIEAGVAEHGVSVHFVDTGLDSGPIIIQARVPVHEDDDPDTLAARVLEQEHVILPRAIRWFAEGRLAIDDARVLLDGEPAI